MLIEDGYNEYESNQSHLKEKLHVDVITTKITRTIIQANVRLDIMNFFPNVMP